MLFSCFALHSSAKHEINMENSWPCMSCLKWRDLTLSLLVYFDLWWPSTYAVFLVFIFCRWVLSSLLSWKPSLIIPWRHTHHFAATDKCSFVVFRGGGVREIAPYRLLFIWQIRPGCRIVRGEPNYFRTHFERIGEICWEEDSNMLYNSSTMLTRIQFSSDIL